MEVIEESLVVHSEEENEMNLINTTKTRKKGKIIDSDSEEETVNMELNVADNEKSKELNTNEEIILNKKPKRLAILDDDSDEDTKNIDNNKDTPGKDSDIIESDTDVVEEEEVSPHNKSFPDEVTAVEAVIYTTNNKGELVSETSLIHKSSLSALCDSESEGEIESDVVDTTVDPVVQPKIYKRPQKKKHAEEKPKQMTVQEAARQRTEIRSESQRMLRESNVSLPYHKPKSYTIKEFLQKRSKLPSAAPLIPKAPPSLAIKMTKDKLKEISKKLDERIKEVKEFYKSESEDEEEVDDASEDIKCWLNLLVDNALDTAEAKINEVTFEEMSGKDSENTEDPTTEIKEPESMDYEFNLDDINEDPKKPKITELFKGKLNIQPRLSGEPDDVIDLEDGATKVSAVKKLVEKFFQHTVKKVPQKHKVQLNVIGVNSGGEITSETISMNVDEDDEPSLVETPGAKLKKLREELQTQMAQKRLELWKQKHEQGDILTAEKKLDDEDEKEKDILDDEEEYELTETESEEEDEEEYEARPEKRRVKSAFIDEEADEDEDALEDDEDTLQENKQNQEIDGEDPEDRNDDNSASDADAEEVSEKVEFKSPRKKVLRRILRPFSVDSDDEDEQSPPSASKRVVKYYTTIDDDDLPPNLPKLGKTPQKPQTEKNKSELEFLTPVTYLTGLQNLNSDSKFLRDSPNSPFLPPLNPLASQEENAHSQIQKKLFAEQSDTSQDSQPNIEHLAQMCSGTFPETQNQTSLEQEVADELPSTQDLLNLCTGGFSTLPTNSASADLQTPSEKPMLHIQNNPEKEIKSLDEEQDQIISQLLDEAELERFKKKFESPLNASVRKSQILEEAGEVNATGLINSDDENEELGIKLKKRKKLDFSDDEEDADEGSENDDSENEEVEEQIDLHADYDDEDEEQQLENEIVAKESYNYKLTDFLDKEAELSESEWGSADEDEKGLDDMEFEQGDEEKFNENKIRSEIERIHMRQLLDEDNREVKILQELLLDDGELHGTGRKRQFKWKALDSVDNGEFDKREDDDIFLDEEESEEQWRKMRHKREMFLKKKSVTEDDDILSDSQILKIGKQVFKQKRFLSQSSTPPNNKVEEDCKTSFTLSSKRGSFLSRSDQVLQRLAEYNKVTTNVGTTVKNSRGFVFQTVEASTTVVKDNNNKRKATEATPKVLKKLRLDNISPAVGKNNATKNSRAKKLFGNW